MNHASSPSQVGTNSRLLKRLIDAQKSQVVDAGGAVFSRFASEIKEILTSKVMRTQALIEIMERDAGQAASWNGSDSNSFQRCAQISSHHTAQCPSHPTLAPLPPLLPLYRSTRYLPPCDRLAIPTLFTFPLLTAVEYLSHLSHT